MVERIFLCWDWTLNEVGKFDTEHWVIAFVVLGVIGMICLRGLGIRGAR